MRTVNMHEAKTHLSRLAKAAAKGEPFVIARSGKPLVKVVALEEAVAPETSPFGFLKAGWGSFKHDPEVDRQIDEEIRREFEESIARGLVPEGYDKNGTPLDDDARRRA